MRPNTKEDFWRKVDMSGGPDACWPWLGALDRGGYGNFVISQKQWITSRFAFYVTHGALPDFVCHHCDNRKCCNPKHLYAGNAKTNAADKINRQRIRPPKGEAASWSKLTAEQVMAMRHEYATGTVTHKALAAKYRVTAGAVRDIIAGVNWAHLPVVPWSHNPQAKRKRDESGRYR